MRPRANKKKSHHLHCWWPFGGAFVNSLLIVVIVGRFVFFMYSCVQCRPIVVDGRLSAGLVSHFRPLICAGSFWGSWSWYVGNYRHHLSRGGACHNRVSRSMLNWMFSSDNHNGTKRHRLPLSRRRVNCRGVHRGALSIRQSRWWRKQEKRDGW